MLIIHSAYFFDLKCAPHTSSTNPSQSNTENNNTEAAKKIESISIKVFPSEQETTPTKSADVIATADACQLVLDSKNLLSSVSAQLVEMKEGGKSAETILLEVEDIEKHIHSHLVNYFNKHLVKNFFLNNKQ